MLKTLKLLVITASIWILVACAGIIFQYVSSPVTPLPTASSQAVKNSSLPIDADTLTAQIGLDPNDLYSGVLAEPEGSPLSYFYKGNGATIYQYNKDTKKFTTMSWHVTPQGSNDTLSLDQHFMLGLGQPDAHGEVRTLVLTDFVQGIQKEVEKVNSPSTYTKATSDFDGSSVGFIGASDNPYVPYFTVEVYLDNPAVAFGTNRTVIATKMVLPK